MSSVLVADADAPTRVGLRTALAAAGLDVVAEAEDAATALTAALRHGPDLAVFAAELPGGALGAMAELAEQRPGIRLVVLTAEPDESELLEAVLAGASGYLSRDISVERLPHALKGILSGEVALPRRHSARLLDELRARRTRRSMISARATAEISSREWEVLELLASGLGTGEMARQLGISEVTVRRHVSTVVAKLGVRDRSAAVALMAGRSVA